MSCIFDNVCAYLCYVYLTTFVLMSCIFDNVCAYVMYFGDFY